MLVLPRTTDGTLARSSALGLGGRLLVMAALTTLSLLAIAATAHAGTPYYYIINQKSGKVLVPENERKDVGAPIVQMTPRNTGAQHWFIERQFDMSNGRTVRQFRNRWSHECIYVQYKDDVVGRQLIQESCEQGYLSAGEWVVSSKTDMWAERPFTAYNNNSGQCMDVAGASLADYAGLIQWPCHGQANQQFRLQYRGTSG